MPSFHLPHFDDVAMLRSIEPNRLRTFLLKFEAYLCSHGFNIPDVANFSDADLQLLIEIFNSHDGSTPAELIEALFHISEATNDQGMEALLLVASKNGIELPEGDLTSADIALIIWHYDRDLLRRANCERIVLRFQSFYCFMNRTLEAPSFSLPSDEIIKQIENRIDQFNRMRQRCGGAAVWMYEIGNEIAFLIRFGGTLRRDEVMDNDVCRPDIRRPVGYDMVVYNIQSGELRIRAEHVGERRFYCLLFGEQLFGDLDFFEHGERFNLDVIYEIGDEVQSPGMTPGIRKITLLAIQEVLLGERSLHTTHKSEAVFEAIREHNKHLSPHGRLVSARFRVVFDNKAEVIVTIYSGNKIRYSRQIGTLAIDQWLSHHGIRVSPNAPLRIQTGSPLASHLANPKSQRTTVPLAKRTG